MAPPPYPPSHSPYNKSFVGVSTTSGVSSSSPALLQDRLENLFEDIKHFLALAPEKIPSIRREEFYKRALRLIGKLDTYANDDTVVDQLEKAQLKLIREYRTKLDIRANRLLETSSSLEVKKKIEQKKNASPMMVNGGEKEEEEPAKEVKKDKKDESASSVYQNANDRQSVKVNPSPLVDVSASASPSVELPFFFGFPGAFPAFYVAIEDLILYNPSLSTRAKYRKIFFSLYVYDQILLSETIDPASPDLALALRLLKERYEPFCEKGLYKPEKFPRSLSVASAEVASGAAQDGISSTAATTTNATIGSNSTQHMKYALKPTTTTTSFNQSDSMYSKHSNKYRKSFY